MATPQAKPIQRPGYKGTGLQTLFGLVSLLLGLYLVLERYQVTKFKRAVPGIAIEVLLIITGILLLNEAARRSVLARIKRVESRYI
ncbi:MAG TPA: hypothetical protein VJC16_00165 [Candidatus Nanoarchaeia archaeon]|nr:hypothetical protein [Candidatus Nanoarchaeia archaeon]